jgi:Zn-dependent peptidase ImmA (M78 family)
MKLVSSLQKFEGVPNDAIERLSVMASMRGLKVVQMDSEQRGSENRDAVIVPTMSGKRCIIYNPDRPRSRVAFSIAHEISHTFFPNSVSGARFRSICRSDSKEANELERLCDLGASELLMPTDEFRKATAGDFGLHAAQDLSERFGSSFEATVFRLASAHPHVAVAGLLRFRLTVSEERLKNNDSQGWLFSVADAEKGGHPKYRRQSLHTSQACGDQYIVRWNKSFDPRSVVYKAGTSQGIHISAEALPNLVGKIGRLEAIRAPYQREDADPQFGDVLFFWSIP